MASWFYKIDDIEHGPISQDELVKMVQHGRLAADDMIRNESKKKWYKARDVKGLKFPDDNKKERPVKDDADSSGASTSAEAKNLLKGFGKKNRDRDSGSVETRTSAPSADSWEARQKASSAAMMSQPVARKPLDRRTKQIFAVAGCLLLVILLFPPHKVPEGQSLPSGWYFRPVFAPPVMSLNAENAGMGNVDIKDIVVEDGKTYVKAPMPIDGFWLFMESLLVLVLAGTACGFLAAKKAAAEVPDPKPAHPPKRRAV